MKLAHGLLRTALARGARLFEADAVAFDAAGRAVNVRMACDREIEARSVVLATGYVMPDIVRSTVHAVSSSWAIATVPQPQNIWKNGALIPLTNTTNTISRSIFVSGSDVYSVGNGSTVPQATVPALPKSVARRY